MARINSFMKSHKKAWNLLGEQYWRAGKIQMAKQCFEGSLSKRQNSRSLRSLSMVLRAIPEKDPKVKMANVKQSFQRAKQAVDLDDSNGLNAGLEKSCATCFAF